MCLVFSGRVVRFLSLLDGWPDGYSFPIAPALPHNFLKIFDINVTTHDSVQERLGWLGPIERFQLHINIWSHKQNNT